MEEAFRDWQRRHHQGWGLAWYLAVQLMARFHASHGLRPRVLQRDGLGYYGIGLQRVPCRVHHQPTEIGRLTMAGDVENWVTGTPGDHGLRLTERIQRTPAMDLVPEAIAHLGLPPRPPTSHIGCRHHRWGDSAILVFRLSARLALRHNGWVFIDNDSAATRAARGLDPDVGIREHPGYTLLRVDDRRVVLANDGRVLEPSGSASLWHRFMSGESDSALVSWLEVELGLPGNVETHSYTMQAHSHRYASWCAARASGRGLVGATNLVVRQALEASELPATLSNAVSHWPSTPSELDAAHTQWCSQILDALHGAGVTSASFGRAAKIVAIYLKTRVVCGGHAERPLGRLAHPPIDRVLLKALAREPGFSKTSRALWRRTRWTELDAAGYAEVIQSLRDEGLDEDGFWRVERWWVGD